MTTVVVLDYGSGNIRSAERAVARAGVEVTVTTDARLARECCRYLSPRVGAFGRMHGRLGRRRGPDHRRPSYQGHRRLPSASATRCCSRPASSTACAPKDAASGQGSWNNSRPRGCRTWAGTIEAANSSQLFAGIESERFYFVHSYGSALLAASERRITWAEHGGDRFVAAVEDGPLWSTQFHPEKSGGRRCSPDRQLGRDIVTCQRASEIVRPTIPNKLRERRSTSSQRRAMEER